jgi:hypothetical protein
MVRHSREKMATSSVIADWNMAYLAFAGTARNLFLFLTNNDKGSDNVAALQFARGGFHYAPGEMPPKIAKLEEQVFHLDAERPISSDQRKFTIGDADDVLSWIEKGVEKFFRSLSTDRREMWNSQVAPIPRPQANEWYADTLKQSSLPMTFDFKMSGAWANLAPYLTQNSVPSQSSMPFGATLKSEPPSASSTRQNQPPPPFRTGGSNRT